MSNSNNLLLGLVVVLLVVSAFGTAVIVSNVQFETPQNRNPTTATGEMKLEILPEPGSDSMTGYMTLEILPDK